MSQIFVTIAVTKPGVETSLHIGWEIGGKKKLLPCVGCTKVTRARMDYRKDGRDHVEAVCSKCVGPAMLQLGEKLK